MKKIIIGIAIVLFVVAIVALILNFSAKSDSKNEIVNSNSINLESKESENTEQKEGYEIIVSKNDITIEKGAESSFEITFTNPDETSIREYIKCEDQDDIILVKYSELENSKITVYIEALKEGTTEILVCDYNYPDIQEIVKVNVIDAN